MDFASIFKITLIWCLAVLYNTPAAIGQTPTLPLIITLPIHIQNGFRTNPSNNNDDGASEERYGEQTMVKNTFGSTEKDNQNDEDDQSNFNPQPSFLTFNPNNKVLLLQISDFISATAPDHQESVGGGNLPEVEDSEEEDHTYQDTMLNTKKNPSWQDQEFYDFEDYVRRLEHKRRRRPKKTSKKTSKRRFPGPADSFEDDVYGSDPVVHFLRNRGKETNRGFHFGHMPPNDDNKYKLEDWWTY